MSQGKLGARLRRALIGDRAFYSAMIAIVVPIIIQNTVSNVVSLLDNVMVGRVGTLEMSAVAIVNQLLFIFNLCIFGGLAGATIGMLIYTIILDLPLKLDVNYGIALLYGIVGSAVGTFGDLCFSIIKRQTGIKDYGNLIPGHGGVLDRFDSLTMVAPLMEALLLILPLIRL